MSQMSSVLIARISCLKRGGRFIFVISMLQAVELMGRLLGLRVWGSPNVPVSCCVDLTTRA